MSLYEDYLKEKKKKKPLYEEYKTERGIVDIQEVISDKDIEEDNSKWFKSGAFKNGYQAGDLTKTVASTVGDIGTGFTKGIMNIGENIGDLIQYGTAGIVDWIGNDEKADELRKKAQFDSVSSVFEPMTDVIDKNSVLGNKSDNIVEGLGYVAGITAVSVLSGGAGTALGISGTSAATIGSTITTFTSAMGSGITEAYKNGATDKEATIYGAISGAGEALSELLFGGLGKISGAAGLSKGIGELDDVIIGGLTKKIKNKMVKTILQSGLKAGGEGLEEIISGLISAAGKKITYMDEKEYSEIVKDENLSEQFWMGALTSAIAQGPSTLKSIKNNTDYISGRTENEQKVYDNLLETKTNEAKVQTAINNTIENNKKVLEEAYGRKLSQEELNTIKETVNDTYNAGKLNIDNIKLSNKKQIEIEEAIEKDFEDGNISIETIRNILGENQDLSKDKGLQRSLHENEQKSNSFQFEKTDNEKINILLQSATDSGLNNTSKTKRRVEIISKLVQDTDRQYKFVNSEQLKELGYNEKANGLINKETGEILINAQSNKEIQAVVGHETTHLFDSKVKGEYTQEYKDLQSAVVDYLKAKGTYETKVNEIMDVYNKAGINLSTEEVMEEVTADTIGDNLFGENSEEFIRQLSTKNRNVFQKIYDYIKKVIKNIKGYNSEEQKTLNNLKEQFDKVYKTINTETSSDTKYSIGGERAIENIQKSDYYKKAVENLELAKKLKNEGKTNAELIKETGWYQDIAGDWKFEFSDKDMELRKVNFAINKEYKLSEILNHDTLFYFYPDLAKYKVFFENKENSSFSRKANIISIAYSKVDDKNELKGTLIHEIQHAIQKIENNAHGTANRLGLMRYYNTLGEIEAADTKERLLNELNNKKNSLLPESAKDNPIHPKIKNGNILVKMANGIYNYFHGGQKNVFKNKENLAQDFSKTRTMVDERGRIDNTKYSISQDSKGRILTKEQQEYFKDSKVRDENGNLKVMYHGTDADFNIFTYENYGKTGTAYGKGFYFTDSKEAGKSYGKNLKEVYLDIKKPMEIGKTTMSRVEFEKLVKEINKATNGIIEADYGNIESAVMEYDYGGDDIDLANSLMNVSGLTIERFYKILRNTLGYDGIKANNQSNGKDGNYYLAFNSNQIKNVDNIRPTENSDIRYSLSDNKGRTLSKQQQEYFKDSKIKDRNGLLMTVYHGTNGDFNIFDKQYVSKNTKNAGFYGDGFYFTPDKESARQYGKTSKEVYLDIKNPFSFSELSKYNGEDYYSDYVQIKNLVELNSEWGNIPVKFNDKNTWGDIYEDVKTMLEGNKTDEEIDNSMYDKYGEISEKINDRLYNYSKRNNYKTLSQVLEEKGYDGIINRETPENSTEIVAFNSNQIKNIDNTNPTENDDIRLSLTQGETNQDWLKQEITENDLIQNSNESSFNLSQKTEDIEELLNKSPEEKQNIMKTKAKNYISRSKTKFINNIVNNFGTSKIANTKILNDIVDRIRNDIEQNGNLTKEIKDTYFNELYNNLVKIDTDYYDMYKDLKDEIRNTKLYISDSISKDIADYNRFRSQNIGNLIMTKDNDNIPVDTYYQELSAIYPELFPIDINNPADQLIRIADVTKDIAKVETNVAAYNDKYLGKDYRNWARETFDKDIDNFSKDIKLAYRYNNATTENEKIEMTKDLVKIAYEQLPSAKREYERVSAKELLTKEDRVQVDRILNNEISINEIPGGLNKKGIIRIVTAKANYDALQKAIKEYQTDIKQSRIKQAQNDVVDLDLWHDKNMGFKFSRETPIRNIYDVAPKDIADNVVNKYFRPYIEINEKKIVDTINQYNERIKKLNIGTKNKYNVTFDNQTKKISESALVQLFGEKKITTEDIVNSGADLSKIENAVSEFRNIYNELINQINDSMLENGYAPIEYRKDYFPHFTESTSDTLLGKAAKLLGIDITNREELPTDIAGQSYKFKPGRTWFGNMLQRTTDVTDYDVLKGFDKYVRGATDLIYHTGDIQNLRALSSAIRGTYNNIEIKNKVEEINESAMSDLEKSLAIQDIYDKAKDKTHLSKFVEWLDNYINILAGKKAINDRGAEKELSRQMYKSMQDIESRISANAIGGNIGVSLTNFAPISQAWGEIKTTNLINGIWQTMKSSLKKDTSFASESQFITRRRGTEKLAETTLDKVTKPLNKLLQFADDFTSEVIVRARYNQNLQQGMNTEMALEEADRYTAGLMGDRGRGALPTQFSNKNPISKMINMFQVEVNNQWSYYLKDLPKNIKEKANNNKAKIVTNTAIAYTKIMVGAYLTNELLGTIRGQSTRVLPDPIYIIKELITGLTDDDDENDDDTFIETLTEVVGNVPFVSLPASLLADSLGLDVGDIGRIPISGAVPNVADITADMFNIINGEKTIKEGAKSIGEELLDTVGASLILPYGGSQIKKTIKGMSLYENDLPGSYTDGGDLRYTVEDDVGSKVQAAIFGAYANPYAQDYIDSGFKTIKKDNIEEMIGLDMNSTEYREFKKNLSKVSNTSDKNGYKQYIDDNDNIYWYDSENEIMYDSNYDKTKLTEDDLTKVSKKEESLNYIDSLDLTDTQKNLVANNLNKNSKKTIDMSEYGNYSSYDEYMYARDYPKKYSIISQITNYDDYIKYKDTIADIKEQYSTELGYESKERKIAVQNYINSLDLNVYQKMMLEKMAGGYSIKNYKNNIYEYLETTELTDSEKYTIWEELFN